MYRYMKINIKLRSYWSIGSGKGGNSNDSLILKDKYGLPYLPGKTLKGLLRDALKDGSVNNKIIIKLLGHEKGEEDLNHGILRINSARINKEEIEKIKGLSPQIFTTKTSNSLDKNKQTEEHSLRTLDRAIPVELESFITHKNNGSFKNDEINAIETGCKMLRKLGENRQRGLGSCVVTLDNINNYSETSKEITPLQKGNTLVLRCTLNDPVVLVKKEKTGQNIESLDYLPGGLIRGIMAQYLFTSKPTNVDDIIFNNIVQFGDGNLVINDKRAYKIPFSYYRSKDEDEEKFKNFHHIKGWGKKIKQVRNGYIVKNNNDELEYKLIEYGSAIKSERNSKTNSSEKGGLFTYHYLKEDQTFEFEISSENQSYLNDIKTHLQDKIFYIGKSKSAEFGGSIQLSVTGFKSQTTEVKSSNIIYADSNICFVNEYGDFTTTDIIENFTKEEDVKIDWLKSQIRTRTYTPYNAHRNNWDSERLIIEKGSVIVLSKAVNLSNASVGCFQNEGFGKIIILNDSSVIPISETVGFTTINPKSLIEFKKNKVKIADDNDSSFVKMLKEKHNRILQEQEDKALADKIYNDNQIFKNISTTQWARVFQETSKYEMQDLDKLKEVLFTKVDKNDQTRLISICKGGAKKWDEKVVADFEKIFEKKEYKINTDVIRRLSKKLTHND